MTLFKQGVAKIKEYYKDIKYIHAEASNGILNVNDAICNLVRPGILLYGYPPADNMPKTLNFRPVAKLKSHVLFLLHVFLLDFLTFRCLQCKDLSYLRLQILCLFSYFEP